MQVIIKRYPNRKLYNTHTKQYITLDKIAELIDNDGEVSVIDAESGDDITAFIFTQVIMGREKQKTGVIPMGLLRMVIRASTDGVGEISQAIQNTVDWITISKPHKLPTRRDVLLLRDKIDELSRVIDALYEREKSNQRHP